jgi:hypothetical protein
MKRRSALFMVALLAALAACSHSPTEPASDPEVWIASELDNVDGGPMSSVDGYLDGRRVFGEGGTTGSGYRVQSSVFGTLLAPGPYTLELRFLDQPPSPSTCFVTGWNVKHLDLVNGQERVLSQADLPDQTVRIATGEAIRWDFNL